MYFLGIESSSWPQLAKVTSQVSRLGVRWTACCERSSRLLIFPQSCDGSLLCTSVDRYTNPNGKPIVALFTVVKGRKLVFHDYERSLVLDDYDAFAQFIFYFVIHSDPK